MVASSTRPSSSRVVVALLAAITFACGLAGCAVEAKAPVGNCSPSYTPSSKYGNFSAQQSGPGASIQWGIYPNVAASRYVVDVYVGNRRVDHKDQAYPPHGSVSATDVRGKGGQVFGISGQAWDGNKNTLVFQLQCHIA
jgi:hypothetical protein